MKHLFVALALGLFGCSAEPVKQAPVKPTQSKVEPECKPGWTHKGDRVYLPDGSAFGPVYLDSGYTVISKCVNGKWAIDEKATDEYEAEIKEEAAKQKAISDHRKALWDALRTRVITDAEMKEILELGTAVIPSESGGFIATGGCGGDCDEYNRQQSALLRDAEIILNNALLNQFKMRTFAKDRDK